MNYNQEQTQHIVDAYKAEANMLTVEKLAEELGKSTKSIIGKLSREEYMKEQSIKTRVEHPLLLRLRYVLISLTIWELRLRVWWVSRKSKSNSPSVRTRYGCSKRPTLRPHGLDPATGVTRSLLN